MPGGIEGEVKTRFTAEDRITKTISDVQRAYDRLNQSSDRVSKTTADLTARQRVFHSVLTEMNSRLTSHARGISSIGTAAAESAGKVGMMTIAVAAAAAIIAGVAVAAMAKLAKATFDAANEFGNYVEEIDKVHARTGLTVMQIKAIDSVAKDLKMSVEDVVPSFRFLSRAIVEARSGNEDMIASFRRVGVTVDDLKQKNLGQVFFAVVQGMGGVSDKALQGYTAMQLFGRGAQNLAPLFGANIEAAGKLSESFNKLSIDQLAAGRDVDRSMDLMNRATEGMKRQFEALAAIILASPLKKLADMVAATAVMVNQAKVVGEALTTVWDAAGRALDALIKKYPALKPIIEFLGLIAEMALRDITKWIPNVQYKPPPGSQGTTAGGAGTNEWPEPPDAARTRLQNINAQIVAIKNAASIESILVEKAMQRLQALKDQTQTLKEQQAVLKAMSDIAGMQWENWMTPAGPYEKPIGPAAPGGVPIGPLPYPNPKEPGAAPDLTTTTDALTGFLEGMNELIPLFDAGESAATSLGRAVGQLLTGSIGIAVDAVIFGSQKIGEAFGNLVKQILADLLKAQLTRLAGGFLRKALGLPFQHGGEIMSGVYGMDTVPGLLRRGENVVDYTTNQMLKNFLKSDVVRMSASNVPVRPASSAVNLFLSPGSITVKGGIFDPTMMRDWIAEYIGPAMNFAQKYGTVRPF